MAELAPDKPIESPVHDPLLSQWLDDVKHTTGEVATLVDSLSDAQMRWKPNPQTWSVLECLEHLLITGNLYYPKIREAIRQSRARGLATKGAFRPSFFGKRFIAFVHPDSQVKLKTFSVFKPTLANTDPGVAHRFLQQQKELRALLHDADGCDLNAIRMSSPLSRFLRFSLGEALWINVLHTHRHYLQARNLTQLEQFPRY